MDPRYSWISGTFHSYRLGSTCISFSHDISQGPRLLLNVRTTYQHTHSSAEQGKIPSVPLAFVVYSPLVTDPEIDTDTLFEKALQDDSRNYEEDDDESDDDEKYDGRDGKDRDVKTEERLRVPMLHKPWPRR